jgi:A/G-specific adenine glycosylase
LDVANINSEKIIIIRAKLLRWYKLNGREFPWRKSKLTRYQIIISETLLQRTKAETVSSFYSKFITDFPNWESLSNATLEILESYLRPIGLYKQRASRLQNLAREMVKRKGKLPLDRQELESIPFMGQYIANAIELLIFKQRSPLLDVNMARVLERYFGERKLSDIRYDPYLQQLSHDFVNHEKSKELNWAILDFAAGICKPKPKCDICPLKEGCLYFKAI